jgi:predicted HicB family RNase H-like nuclease
MNEQDPSRKQLGVRIAGDLIIEAKVLAARQGRKLNEVIEEAIQEILKKYEKKRKDRG